MKKIFILETKFLNWKQKFYFVNNIFSLEKRFLISKLFLLENISSALLGRHINEVLFTAWKVSVFGVFRFRIQSECGKIWIRKTSNKGTFYTVLVCYNFGVCSQEGLISRNLIILGIGLLTSNIKLKTHMKNEVYRRD